MSEQVYFDNSATTKICEEALAKYIEISRECFGNPSSLHSMGFAAEQELKRAREQVCLSLGAKDSEVCFTASGSEANNLACFGRALSKDRYRAWGKILITDGEHASVNECLRRLSDMGFKTAKIPTKGGKIDTGALIEQLTPDVILISMMMVNNESGALYDIATVAREMRARCPEAYLHVDATQSYLKLPFTKASIGADMITVSSHKIEGPKGVGALVIDKRIIKEKGICPMILGGGQEGGLRSGTENVPAVAAFGEAVRIGKGALKERFLATSALREYIIKKIKDTAELEFVKITNPDNHAPHILNITLPGIKSETVLHHLSSHGVYVSSGSACSSNSHHSSSALLAYGISEADADSSIRISISHRNTEEDADKLVYALAEGAKRLSRIR